MTIRVHPVHENDVEVSLQLESQVKESCTGEEREDVHLFNSNFLSLLFSTALRKHGIQMFFCLTLYKNLS